MSLSLDNLIDRLEMLPDKEREQWLARFAHELADAQNVYALSDEERSLIREGIADLDAGRVVSEVEMEAFWNRNRRA